MRLGPPTFPLLAPDLEKLSPEERAWCEYVRPWYARAATIASPRQALKHPLTREFKQDRSHWPMFVRFYADHPLVFELILEHVTGGTVRGKTVSERQRAWRAKVA